MSNVSKPFVEYSEEGKYGTSTRNPTAEELAESELRRTTLNLLRERLKAIRVEIEELESGCPHTVSYDMAGFPYDLRFCYGCGISRGSV